MIRGMARTRRVEQQAVDDLLKGTASVAVGATAAHPGAFPASLGIGRRETPRNTYLGCVVTRPEADTLVLGLTYFDSADNCDNEDMYRIDMTTLEIRPY